MNKTKIGSFNWMLLTDGQLKAKDKVKLVNQIVVPSMMGVLKTQLSLGSTKNLMKMKDIIIPDTKIIKEAINELDSKANTSIINHSWRTYFWGAAIGQIDKREYDPEVLLVSSLYHDIGLTDEHRTTKGCKCFTYESALQFEKKAKEIHYDETKTELVKEAICMHMNGHVDEHNESEVILLQQGASCDVVGNNLLKLPIEFRDKLLNRYPRHNFNKVFKKLLAEESKKVDNSRTQLLSLMGLPLMITMNPFKE